MKNKISAAKIINNYKYSIKRRISTSYALVFVLVCVLILIVFSVSFTYYSCEKLSDNTPVAISAVSQSLVAGTDIKSTEFRNFLNSLRRTGSVSEILIYDTNNVLINATSLSPEVLESRNGGNIITQMFPQYSQLFQGYYIDSQVVRLSSVGIDINIYVYYSIDSVIASLLFTVSVMATAMFIGLIAFSLAGYVRTKRMLQPIDDITQVAKKITSENMNLRIDEENSRYELKELVETINSMIDRLQLDYDRQKRFVSDVSHELRTPISVISGYGSMLKRWGKSDEAVLDESIDAIINESDNMKDLVEKLLFIARHDNETLQFDMKRINITQLISATVKEESIVHTKAEFELHADEEVYASVDETRFKQAIRIFLDNAIKYSSESSKVQVTLKPLADGFSVSIRDHGQGINKEDLPNIFERFYRADESRTKQTGGYGLGLAIARIIVSGHGGSITVRTKHDVGSEFIICIPYLSSEKEVTPA